MTFDTAIACISYRDPTLLVTLLVCTVVWSFCGARIARLWQGVGDPSPRRFHLVLSGIALVLISPFAVAALVQGAAGIETHGTVQICFHFVRPALFLPGLAGLASTFAFADRRDQKAKHAAA